MADIIGWGEMCMVASLHCAVMRCCYVLPFIKDEDCEHSSCMPVWKLADSKGMDAADAEPIVTRSTATVHPIQPAMIPAVFVAWGALRTSLKQDLRDCMYKRAVVLRHHAHSSSWGVCLREDVGRRETGGVSRCHLFATLALEVSTIRTRPTRFSKRPHKLAMNWTTDKLS